MNLYARLFMALLRSWGGERAPHDEVNYSRFRVWPHDLDAFGHMNNGRYLQIMDVSRAQWMARTGVLRAMRRQKWGAVLGGNITRYRRSLKPFQSYSVQTNLVCWDDRWFFFKHMFLDRQGRCVAVGLSRAALRAPQGWVATCDVVEQVQPGVRSPEMPEYFKAWVQAENVMYRDAQPEAEAGVARTYA